MWTRAELKTNAKGVLQRNYWKLFAASLIYGVIAGAFSGTVGSINSISINVQQLPGNEVLVATLAIIMLVVGIISLLLGILVAGPMLVGLYRFFLESREHPAEFSLLFWGFTGGRYWKNVKVMFFVNLKIVLWSLLLLIPGIVKSFEYYMIPYLLAENPNLETKRYFEISRQMTDGEKMNIFVLGLSFIGWELLGILACCVGTYFVVPYVYATYAELYALMRAKAFSAGIAGPEELCGFGPTPGDFTK